MPRNSSRIMTGARPGFSIMEALVVVILLGIISSMAVPSIARSMTSTRADRATQAVANDVEAAFSLAARQRKPVTLFVDTVRLRIEIRDRATATVLQSRSYSLTESEFGLNRLLVKPSDITIFPNGLANVAFNIYTFAGPTGRAVRVRRTGHIRVTAP